MTNLSITNIVLNIMSCIIKRLFYLSVIAMTSKTKISCDSFKSEELFYQDCISNDLNNNFTK